MAKKDITATSIPVSVRVERIHAAGLDILAERAQADGRRATRSSMVNDAIVYFLRRQRVGKREMLARVKALTEED